MRDAEKKLLKSIGVRGVAPRTARIWKYNLNYVIIGSGPALLLLHGANIGWGMWYRNIVELARYFTVIAVDLPGSGYSSHINFFETKIEEDFARAFEKFIKKVGLEIPFVAGHSFGGWLAAKLFLNGKKFKKLVFIDSVGFSGFVPPQYRLISFKPFALFLSKFAVKPTRENMKEFLSSVLSDKTKLADELVDYYFEGLCFETVSHPLLFMHAMTSKGAIKKSFLLNKSELKSMPPTLTIWGDNDSLMPLRKSLEMINCMPNRQLEICSAGHVPPLEQADFVNKRIILFLLK
ncbi:alpha/beta hydrolase [Patescibacteria group bacterium]|nr:alpha/beta hydrolase [Patescibacteria group bacterium]MBU1612853.1 alpha/beta hydrolase [Patescibacteria group bacterium]